METNEWTCALAPALRRASRQLQCSSASLTSGATEATPRAPVRMRDGIEQRAVVAAVAGGLHDHVALEAQQVAQREELLPRSVAGVYLRSGAQGNTAAGPKTWQCASTAPGGGVKRGLDGFG
ncbi:tripartite-type tricarboxylate transporter receptor subunit TctC [Variovorax paradoxus]|nr:tripartite-type tricarboxylate transporter receptor subunit TctC [Variovorax paradoxus]